MNETLDLKVGWHCNNNCLHCVVADKREYTEQQNFTLEEIKKFILENPAEEIVLTGGEPTLRNDIIEICQFIKMNTFSTLTMQTNGRRLVKEIVTLIDTFVIALHSFMKEIHDKITQRIGSWNETIETIRYLLNICPQKLCTQTVISKINLSTLYKTSKFFEMLGIQRYNITFPHAMGNAWYNFDEVVPQYKEIRSEIKNIIDACKNYNLHSIPACELFPHQDLMRSALSEYKPKKENTTLVCMELCNTTGSNFYDKIQTNFAKPESCRMCVYNDACLGVWGEYVHKFKYNMDLKPVQNYGGKLWH